MAITDPEGDALLQAMRDAIQAVKAHQYPELYEDTVEDDGETYQSLRCPVCGTLASEGTIAAVSVDEHWCNNGETDEDSLDHQYIAFDPDIDRDLGDTIFYIHNDDHPVSLPDGYTEQWS